MSKLSDYLALKKKVDQLHADVSRMEGALEQLMEQLEREFGCKSIKQAKRLLQNLSKKLEQLEHDSKEQTEAFEGKWNERLRRASQERD